MRICLLLLSSLFCCVCHADIIVDWNIAALEAIKQDKTAPPRAARALAILHTAIYDSVNGIAATHERYLVSGRPAGEASTEAAVHAAAHACLVRTFPAQKEVFNAGYARALEALPNSAAKNSGVLWGQWVANSILTARSTDGSEETVAYVSKSGPGEWIPTLPKSAPALLPQWQNVVCFGLSGADQFRPSRMPALSSAVYAFDFDLTRRLGAKDSKERTAEQTAIATFWADGPGTVTPPGHWNLIAGDLAIQRDLSLASSARLFALLNVALADAGIACWDCKYVCNFWRPITAIRNADSDKNPATVKEPDWSPLLDTPPFPEYTSGHSTFSGAAAAVLARFFGSDEIPFSTSSDSMQGFSRKFHSFSEAASEAGMSRIFGGIHFMSANREGLACGAQIGAYVFENLFEERPPGRRKSDDASRAEAQGEMPRVPPGARIIRVERQPERESLPTSGGDAPPAPSPLPTQLPEAMRKPTSDAP